MSLITKLSPAFSNIKFYQNKIFAKPKSNYLSKLDLEFVQEKNKIKVLFENQEYEIFINNFQIDSDSQGYFVLKFFAESLGYQLFDNALFKLAQDKNKKFHNVYLSSDLYEIFQILDLSPNQDVFIIDEHYNHHYTICNWISNSRRFDTKKFFEYLKPNILEEGLISDLSKTRCTSSIDEVLSPKLTIYIEHYLKFSSYRENPKFSNIFIRNIIGNVTESTCLKCKHFLNSRFGFLEYNEDDLIRDLNTWFKYS